jgi:hypothetical protein
MRSAAPLVYGFCKVLFLDRGSAFYFGSLERLRDIEKKALLSGKECYRSSKLQRLLALEDSCLHSLDKGKASELHPRVQWPTGKMLEILLAQSTMISPALALARQREAEARHQSHYLYEDVNGVELADLVLSETWSISDDQSKESEKVWSFSIDMLCRIADHIKLTPEVPEASSALGSVISTQLKQKQLDRHEYADKSMTLNRFRWP